MMNDDVSRDALIGLLRRLKLTHAEAAEILGYSLTSVDRKCAGRQPVRKADLMALLYWSEHRD